MQWIERYTRGDRPNLLKGALAGAAGGFVGTLRMGRVGPIAEKVNHYWTQWSGHGGLKKYAASQEDPPFGDATQARAQEAVAAAAIRAARGGRVTKQQRETGAAVIHQATGVVLGAVYGVAVEYAPALHRGYGLPLGLLAFVLGRQASLPLAGLAPPPTKQPAGDQLLSLASYAAYGFFTELIRSRLRESLEPD